MVIKRFINYVIQFRQETKLLMLIICVKRIGVSSFNCEVKNLPSCLPKLEP